MEIQKKMTGGLDFRCEVKGCRYRNGSAGQTDQRVTTRGSPRLCGGIVLGDKPGSIQAWPVDWPVD